MSKKTRIALSSVFFLLVLLVLSRCDYSTKVIASADSPETVFSDFISAMKEKDFDKADSYLANGATIRPVNETGYSFFDDYVSISLDSLKYDTIDEPQFDGTNAKLNVRLTSLNISDFVKWTKDNISRIEHDYMLNHDLNEFDKNDRNAVDKVLSMALKEFARTSEGSVNDIEVRFVYKSSKWRIVGNDSLIVSIFGGKDNNENNKKEAGTESEKKS